MDYCAYFLSEYFNFKAALIRIKESSCLTAIGYIEFQLVQLNLVCVPPVDKISHDYCSSVG